MSAESLISFFAASDWVFVLLCVLMVIAAFVLAFPGPSLSAESHRTNLHHARSSKQPRG